MNRPISSSNTQTTTLVVLQPAVINPLLARIPTETNKTNLALDININMDTDPKPNAKRKANDGDNPLLQAAKKAKKDVSTLHKHVMNMNELIMCGMCMCDLDEIKRVE